MVEGARKAATRRSWASFDGGLEPLDAEQAGENSEGAAIAHYAKLDPGLLGMPLFRPLPRKGREEARKQRFEADTEHGGRRLKVLGPFVLGADDLSVLLAVLGLAGLLGLQIEATDSETAMVEIRDGLESEGEAAQAAHIRIRTSLHAICREAGIEKNGRAYDRVEASLSRMRGIYYNDYGPIGANSRRIHASSKQNLLHFRTSEADGEFVVVVNARFAAVLLGNHFVRVNLNESRNLCEMARLLHLRLSVIVREGRSWSVGIDRLCQTLYGSEAKTQRERLDRRAEVREGLAELGAVPGWTITDNRRRQLVIVERTKPSARAKGHEVRDDGVADLATPDRELVLDELLPPLG